MKQNVLPSSITKILGTVAIFSSLPYTTLEAKLDPLIDIPYQSTLDLEEEYFCSGFETYEELRKGARAFAKSLDGLKYRDLTIEIEGGELRTVDGFAILPRENHSIFSSEGEGVGYGISSEKHSYYVRERSSHNYEFKLTSGSIDSFCEVIGKNYVTSN